MSSWSKLKSQIEDYLDSQEVKYIGILLGLEELSIHILLELRNIKYRKPEFISKNQIDGLLKITNYQNYFISSTREDINVISLILERL